MKTRTLIGAVIVIVILTVAYRGMHPDRSRVLIIGIDAATWDVIIPLVEKGELPGFKAFIDRGAYGVLRSFQSVQPSTNILNAFTPAVWTTIATGKTPEEHNILDFTAGYDTSLYKAVLKLTGVIKPPGRLTLELLPNPRVPVQNISVYCNQRFLAKFTMPHRWQDYTFTLDQDNDTRLELEIYYDARCPVVEKKRGRDTAFALRKIQFTPALMSGPTGLPAVGTAPGTAGLTSRPVRNRILGDGWYDRGGTQPVIWAGGYIFTPATMDLLRADPFWRILKPYDKTVTLVGWWLTYPVEPVNGDMVSIYSGYRIHEINNAVNIPALFYPPALYDELKPFMQETDTAVAVFIDNNIAPLVDAEAFRKPKHLSMIKGIFAQDRVFHAMGKYLFKRRNRDVTTVYLESVDSVQHIYWEFHSSPRFAGSPLDAAVINSYRYVDTLLQEYLALIDGNDYLMVISDHGFGDSKTHKMKGDHRLEGIFCLIGPDVVPRRIAELSVYDMLPTLMYLLDLPVSRELKGQPAVELFTPGRQARMPLRWIDSYAPSVPVPTSVSKGDEQFRRKMNEEQLQRLKSLGYLK